MEAIALSAVLTRYSRRRYPAKRASRESTGMMTTEVRSYEIAAISSSVAVVDAILLQRR